MAITESTFRARFPEFADNTVYSDDRINLFIADSLLYMGTNADRWCGKYDYAQAYLVGHLLAVGTLSEAGDTNSKGGVITSTTAGGVSVGKTITSKARSDGDEFLNSTTYGQTFIVTRNSCFVGVLVAS